jgi:thiopeptide-type bacteriocin biosynthesis protein
VAAALATLPARLDESHLFQVDVVRPAPAARLGKAVADDLGRAIEILHRIGEPGQGWLTDFVKAFEQRYGDREVSLFEALDEELGVGFGGGKSLRAEAERLIADLPFPATEDAAEQTWSQRDRYLLGKCAACWTEGSLVLELAEADLKRLAARSPRPLPDAVTVLCSLFGDQSAIDSGDYRLLVDSVVGPSGAQLLGRFCHADAELQAALAGHLRQEEALRPEAVYAEIVCQPEDRVGNILSRPLLRDYEIPYLGRSGAPTDAQIPVADLRIAVRAGRIVLRSVRLGREVLPRLANAHNISHPRNPGVYRFLAALQSQGVMGALWWNWGPLDAAPLLPRVTVGRVVLARARWLATSDELQAIDKCRGAARYRSFQAWRERRRLPRHALLVEDDHELLLDFDNIYCIDSLLARSEHTVVLAEWLAAAGQFAAHGPEGAYCHELVVPFVARARPPAPVGVAQPGNAAEVPRGERCFVPGSEWLYVKLYGGSASADHLLYRLVLPFGRRQVADGRALRWFFIRYADPAPHLRWRLQVPPGGLATVLAQLHAETEPWLAAGHLHRIELGTYEREVERYGGLLGSKLAEELFCADSVAVAEIVAAYHGDRGQDARWRLALLGLDRLLADFALDREARLRLLTLLRDQFAREFKADSHLRQRIGVRLRNERMSLLRLIDEGPAPDDALHAGGLALQRRSTLLVPLARRIAAPGALGALTVPDVLPSYLHMFVNRIFRSAQRAQEYVLYDLLAALYRTPARKDRPDA